MLVIANSPNHNQPAMKTDAHLRSTTKTAQPWSKGFELVLDIQGSLDGALGIVFVGARRDLI
jgi:hypothetical protein